MGWETAFVDSTVNVQWYETLFNLLNLHLISDIINIAILKIFQSHTSMNVCVMLLYILHLLNYYFPIYDIFT